MKHVYDWPDEVWALCETLAKGKSGPEVVRALRAASAKVYATGMDKAFAKFSGKRGLSDAETAAYDIGWLTVWAAELNA